MELIYSMGSKILQIKYNTSNTKIIIRNNSILHDNQVFELVTWVISYQELFDILFIILFRLFIYVYLLVQHW